MRDQGPAHGRLVQVGCRRGMRKGVLVAQIMNLSDVLGNFILYKLSSWLCKPCRMIHLPLVLRPLANGHPVAEGKGGSAESADEKIEAISDSGG